jgi:preprotein translocase subunit SecB
MADIPQTAPEGVVFTIEKVYVKDLSLECPGSPQSFKQQEQPHVEVGLRTRGEQIEPDVYECVLTVTLTAKTGEKTLFLVEASQAGIFRISGIPPEHLQPVIAINCPTVLFPYLRETLADAVGRAGFPPVHLAPITSGAYQQLAQALQPMPATAATSARAGSHRARHDRDRACGTRRAADFKSTSDATVVYDAPSAK